MEIVRREQREAFITADGSSIRELAGIPAGNAQNQSLAEATVPATTGSSAQVRATDAEMQAGVQKALVAYAAAIEAEDVEAIANVYPAITVPERGSWMGFFQDVGSLQVTFAVKDLRRTGDASADATVSGTYAYTVASSQRPVRRTVSFVASLVRAGSGWHIVGFH